MKFIVPILSNRQYGVFQGPTAVKLQVSSLQENGLSPTSKGLEDTSPSSLTTILTQ
jgi:hypothetical protein